MLARPLARAPVGDASAGPAVRGPLGVPNPATPSATVAIERSFFQCSAFFSFEYMERKVVEGLPTVLICALPGSLTTGLLLQISTF